MNDQTDSQLMHAYAENRSEAAFAELVRRHVDFVYSAARRMVVDPHLAQDVTQSVFVAFAKNARPLMDRPVLSGWLHRTAQNIAAQTVRTIERRRAREQEAVAINELLDHESDAGWENIAPHLDTALGELSEPDRDALLLRYFERKSAREMAQALNVSEEAAQKRVNRAVERLREFFSKRNVTVGASGLAVLISTNAVQAAPVGLLVTISSAVSLFGAAVQSSTALIATKAIAMTTIQKTLVTVAITAAVGTSFYQAHQTSRLREELRASRQQSAEKIREIENQRDAAADQLASLVADGERSNDERAELLRLRGEVGRLRTREQALANIPKTETKQPDVPEKPAINNLPKTAWQDAGFATPLAALQTRGYSILNSDREKFRQSIFISDGARKILMDMFEKMVADNPNETKVWVEGALNSNWDIEEGFLMPMIAENRDKGYLGYKVLSQQESGPNETILEVETQMASAPAKKETVKMRRFGQDWKFVVDEEMLNRQFGRK